jgi:hypothetical protein
MRSRLPNKLMSESPGQSRHTLPIGHQPLRANARHSGFGPAAVLLSRGRVMMNSVNTPGSISTSILPPCCLTCCVQRYVSALAAAAELQREPGLARSG